MSEHWWNERRYNILSAIPDGKTRRIPAVLFPSQTLLGGGGHLFGFRAGCLPHPLFADFSLVITYTICYFRELLFFIFMKRTSILILKMNIFLKTFILNTKKKNVGKFVSKRWICVFYICIFNKLHWICKRPIQLFCSFNFNNILSLQIKKKVWSKKMWCFYFTTNRKCEPVKHRNTFYVKMKLNSSRSLKSNLDRYHQ